MSRGALPGDLLRGLQRTAGNQAVRRLVDRRRATAPDSNAEEWVHVEAVETIDPSMTGWPAWLAAALDGVPRMMVEVAGRTVPAFRAATIVALAAGLLAGLLAAPLAGVRPALWALACLGTAGLLVAVLLVHRLINYAFQAVASIGVLVAGLALPGSALAMLDVGAVALAVATGVGRVGCALAGCCHGRPSRVGLRYGVEHVRATFPARLAGVPLLPVQLIESVICLLLAGAVAWSTAVTPAGGGFVTWTVAYATLRWATEGLRGDRRPRFMGVSQARWTSALLGVGVLILAMAGFVPAGPVVSLLAGAVPLLVVGEAVRWRLGRATPTMRGDFTTWDALASALHALTLDPAQDDLRAPPTVTTPDGVRLSLTRGGGRGGTVTTWGLSVDDGDQADERIRSTARSILRMRHPGGAATLLRGRRGVSCLIVGDVGHDDPSATPEPRRS